MNISNEGFIPPASHRQIRQTVSYCKELPQIEHAQLLSDNTTKHKINDRIVYSGSLLFVCQYGFINENSSSEPFRLTCHNGAFHPKMFCFGKKIYY